MAEWAVCHHCPMTLCSDDDLRSVFRSPGARASQKVVDRLDEHCSDFLSKCPVFVLSTANADGGCDGSPNGGAPGFVKVLDENRLAWADLSGDNRLDSFENIVTNNRVALLFLIPGLDEMLHVSGTAELSTDEELCRQFAVGEKPARLVVVVTVVEAFLHCSKALRLAEMWSPDTWLGASELPSPAAMLRDHIALDVDVSDTAQAVERDPADMA